MYENCKHFKCHDIPLRYQAIYFASDYYHKASFFISGRHFNSENPLTHFEIHMGSPVKKKSLSKVMIRELRQCFHFLFFFFQINVFYFLSPKRLSNQEILSSKNKFHNLPTQDMLQLHPLIIHRHKCNSLSREELSEKFCARMVTIRY